MRYRTSLPRRVDCGAFHLIASRVRAYGSRKNNFTFCCRMPCPRTLASARIGNMKLASRQPCGARRRAGICGVAAPRRCHHIACVAAPCICPPGARAKMPTYSCASPKLAYLVPSEKRPLRRRHIGPYSGRYPHLLGSREAHKPTPPVMKLVAQVRTGALPLSSADFPPHGSARRSRFISLQWMFTKTMVVLPLMVPAESCL